MIDGLTCLHYLVANDMTYRDQAGNVGAIEVVLDILNRSTEDVMILALACSTLDALINDHAANQGRALAGGAVDVLVSMLLLRRELDLFVQSQSIWMNLVTLTSLPMFLDHHRNRACASGVIALCLRGMAAGADQAALASSVLFSVLTSPDGCADDEFKKRLAQAMEAGVLDAVSKLLLTMPPAPTALGVSALMAALATDRANQDFAGAAGWVSWMVLAMQANADNVLSRFVCQILSYLVADHKANQDLAGSAGACEAAVALLQHPMASDYERFAGMAVLQSLTCDHSANQERAGAAGALTCLFAAQSSRHGGLACFVLNNLLVRHNANRQRLQAELEKHVNRYARHAPRVLAVIDRHLCTRVLGAQSLVGQWLYPCLTCSINVDCASGTVAGVCASCYDRCHAGHRRGPVPVYAAASTCHCGVQCMALSAMFAVQERWRLASAVATAIATSSATAANSSNRPQQRSLHSLLLQK